ncbi:copper amine oxidase N-terminal domain-containing protein [Paenibacillus sp. ATY16]|uniref:stalk domain-containing protein n=1 Tax=Paenibacillus sp. ATY16 TaxID=1759312 RepID=UPI00200F7F24|nr:copper amine oxidase N-terminal domain-containing protein [Paenibacillus sp. ATY16]
MMKSLRHYTLMLLIVALCTVLPLTAGAASSSVTIKTQAVNLKFDGQSLALPDGQYAFIYQDRTYIPVRFISYALQKSVKWDQKTSKVTVSEPTAAEKEALAKLLAGAAAGGAQPAAGKSITIKPVQATLVFDGQTKALPTGQSLYSINNSIYVPLRFMSEAVGTDIKWDQKTNSITGESAAYKAAQAGGNTGGGTTSGGTTGGTDPSGETKPSYESITSSAEAKLASLKTSCESTLGGLYFQYLAATDDTTKATLKSQGQQAISKCQSDFEKIIADTTDALTKNGYSTDVIASYRTEFDGYMKQINDLAASLK